MTYNKSTTSSKQKKKKKSFEKKRQAYWNDNNEYWKENFGLKLRDLRYDIKVWNYDIYKNKLTSMFETTCITKSNKFRKDYLSCGKYNWKKSWLVKTTGNMETLMS